MILDVYIENKLHKIDIPEDVFTSGADFFAMMDDDMDKGWKMGPKFIENPDSKMRAQIAASRIPSALEKENTNLLHLLAGYIVTRQPGTEAVNIDMNGEPLNTDFIIK
ncbi:MAG: hypothetical protein KAS48_08980 [Gammaproteobacteria bacterium]|nr:hypothetical protein [Gammaproteobacteria bacterium]